ncbi:protein Spindly-A-like [Haliotis cracherodii]|uniref:protein Spindly-A-like n=1 Tax=Haliotis cracherodii TaxID=6455 RepID=UPI0039EA0A9A
MEDSDVSILKEELAQKDGNLMKAVEIGKALLEENSQLKEQIEDVAKNYSKKVEAKEQELYSLQMKYDQKASLEKWYNEEIMSLKQEMAVQRERITDELEAKLHQEAGQFRKQISHLQADLELSQNAERQLREHVKQLEDLVKEQMNETTNISRSFYSEELGQAQQEIVTLQNDKTALKTQMIEMEAELRHYKEERELLRSHLCSKDEEIEDLQCQVTSYCNNQERFHVEILDLKAQLEALRMEASSHDSKGNSLFSEVEDRRVVAEKKLISLNVQIEMLKEKCEIEKQQHHKLKMQMVMLLQMSGGQSDREAVDSLQSQLSDANSQIKNLASKIEELEKTGHGQADHMAAFHKVFGNGSKEDYVQYLHNMLKAKEKELAEVGKELRVTSMLLLDSKNKVLQQRKEIFTVEEEKAKLHSQSVKLYLQNEELLLKYDPEKLKEKKHGMVFKKEKIPLDDSEDETEEEKMKIRESHGIEGLDASTILNKTGNKSVLVESQRENIKSGEDQPGKKCTSVRLPGERSVSLSDDVTVVNSEGEKEQTALVDEEKPGRKEGGKPKAGRVVTKVKISRANPNQVNECKNQ